MAGWSLLSLSSFYTWWRLRDGGGGVYFWGNLRKIKALFVLRGIGEWVQLVAAAVT